MSAHAEATATTLMDALVSTTAAQLEAAKRLDGSELERLNLVRNDQLFALRVALQEPMETSVLEEFKLRVLDLAGLEDRLERVSASVLAALEGLAPRAPANVYTGRGRLAAG